VSIDTTDPRIHQEWRIDLPLSSPDRKQARGSAVQQAATFATFLASADSPGMSFYAALATYAVNQGTAGMQPFSDV
jgi:hypothetical protein